MIESIKNFFVSTLGSFGAVFICSMLPIIELRGSIPLGAALGMPWWENFIVSVVGTLIPVFPILLFIRAILDWMDKTRLRKISQWVRERADKRKARVERAEFWGLVLFVAIPIPGTGAWTGSLIAALLGIERKQAFLAIALGALGAGIIMTLASYGVVEALASLA